MRKKQESKLYQEASFLQSFLYSLFFLNPGMCVYMCAIFKKTEVKGHCWLHWQHDWSRNLQAQNWVICTHLLAALARHRLSSYMVYIPHESHRETPQQKSQERSAKGTFWNECLIQSITPTSSQVLFHENSPETLHNILILNKESQEFNLLTNFH